MDRPDPGSAPRTTPDPSWVDGALDWFVGAPLQSLVAITVGLVVLTVVRWMIGRSVRSVIDGGAAVRRRTRRLLLRTRVGTRAAGIVEESSPLGVARRVQRAETMGSVLRSAAALVVTVLVLTALANINNWDLGPVLASAGVVGVALGFGAQTLVKDFLSGIFLLVEDQFGVGDVVNLGEASGSVEAVGLRVTRLRALDGTVWYVRNGEILRVGNQTQGWSRALVELQVRPDEDVAATRDVLLRTAERTLDREDLAPHVLEEPGVTAFEALTAESVTLRVMVKVAPARQWEVQRALREDCLRALAEAGVDLALPRREVLVEREQGPR